MKRELIVAVLLALPMALRLSGDEHPIALDKLSRLKSKDSQRL